MSFDRDPTSYDRGRPEYPPEAFENLFAYLRERRPAERFDVLELGPGTGQATKPLLARSAHITAVEIGPHLAEFLRQKFVSQPKLDVINSAFEDADLPAASFDLLFAATAWQWFDAEMRVRKAHDLLRPGGVLATLSTIQIRSGVDHGFFDRTFSIYKHYRPNEQQSLAPVEEEVMPTEYEEFRSSGLLEDVEVRPYRWDQTYTTETYEQLLRSYSDTQMMQPSGREGLIRDLKAVIDSEYGGTVVRPLVIALTMGRCRGES